MKNKKTDTVEVFLLSLTMDQLDTLPQHMAEFVKKRKKKKQAYELRKLKRSGAITVTATEAPAIVSAMQSASDLGYDISCLVGEMTKYMKKSS